MGMSASASASAIVFWGYDLGAMVELEEPWRDLHPQWMQEDKDWGSEAACRLGWRKVPFPEELNDLGCDEAGRRSEIQSSRAYQDWKLSITMRNKIVSSLGLDLGFYGHCDGDTMWFACVKETIFRVGYECKAIGDLRVGVGWRERLDRFVSLLELPVVGRPGWRVTTYYG